MRLLIAISILMSLFSCKQYEWEERVIKIGKELTQVNSEQISDLVFIGNGLRETIHELQENTTDFEFQITDEDLEKPFGNNEADVVLTILSDYKNIQIRLKYDKVKDKYHILGWKTLNTL